MYQGQSSYLKRAFDEPHLLVKDALTTLKDVEYDTMIGTGLSGSLVIPLLARALHKNFAIVRKDNDSGHRERKIEGTIGDRWIFVDDFVSSGNTEDRVVEAVKELSAPPKFQLSGWEPFSTVYVGTYEYHFQRFIKFKPKAATNKRYCNCSACENL